MAGLAAGAGVTDLAAGTGVADLAAVAGVAGLAGLAAGAGVTGLAAVAGVVEGANFLAAAGSTFSSSLIASEIFLFAFPNSLAAASFSFLAFSISYLIFSAFASFVLTFAY